MVEQTAFQINIYDQRMIIYTLHNAILARKSEISEFVVSFIYYAKLPVRTIIDTVTDQQIMYLQN